MALDLHVVQGALLVIPEKFDFVGSTGCPQGDATQGMGDTPQVPVRGADGASWPVLTLLPLPLPHQAVLARDGLVAAYLPKPILDLKFGKVAPAVTYRDTGNGFIGYNVELTAAIKGVTVSIDVARMALRLELHFPSCASSTPRSTSLASGRWSLAMRRCTCPRAAESRA